MTRHEIHHWTLLKVGLAFIREGVNFQHFRHYKAVDENDS